MTVLLHLPNGTVVNPHKIVAVSPVRTEWASSYIYTIHMHDALTVEISKQTEEEAKDSRNDFLMEWRIALGC